jgi:hypothetical protein
MAVEPEDSWVELNLDLSDETLAKIQDLMDFSGCGLEELIERLIQEEAARVEEIARG